MEHKLIDLKAQYQSLKPQIDEAVSKVMESGNYILGKNVNAFEQEFAEYNGFKYGVGVASGTDALIIALRANSIINKSIITTPLSFFATTEAILQTGNIPQFVDVSYGCNIELSSTIDIPVEFLGNSLNTVNEKDFTIVDCAQSAGLKQKSGKTQCYSFFPGKNLGCMGDGGMILTDSLYIADKCRILRKHGAILKSYHECVGYNSRLDEIQAAILRVKLPYLDTWVKRRQEIAKIYNSRLSELGYKIIKTNKSVYNYYVFYHPEREKLAEYLKSKGIETGCYYKYPLHLLPATEHLGYRVGDFPTAEYHCENNIALPMYPELTDDMVKYYIDVIRIF